MKKKIKIIGAILFGMALFTFTPVITTEWNSREVTGQVKWIYEAGVNDACIRLEDDPSIYYINRGLENGLNLDELKTKYEGEEVTLYYARHWSFLNFSGKFKHITQFSFDDQILYSEF